ncbi:hypothetical protein OSTOST_03356 [Ostertagia ostertagi]
MSSGTGVRLERFCQASVFPCIAKNALVVARMPFCDEHCEQLCTMEWHHLWNTREEMKHRLQQLVVIE